MSARRSRPRVDPVAPAVAAAAPRRSRRAPAPDRTRGRPRRLAEPRAAEVVAAADGRPEAIDGRTVDAIRESWLVEDRWWTDAPLRRRYWEVVTTDGRNLVVFRDLGRGRWFAQR